MTHSERAMSKTETVFLVALVLSSVLSVVQAAPHRRPHLRTLRLCSRSLSDALYIVCRDHGYNEPFQYSGEDEPKVPSGPGLVDECCYHACSYHQLQQYCKRNPDEKLDDSRDVIEESLRIVNLPYSSTGRSDLSSEESPRAQMDYTGGGAIKRKVEKVDDLKRGRHRGKGARNDGGECKGNADTKKRHRGRHCRCRRRRLECRQAGKVLPQDVMMILHDHDKIDKTFTTLPPTDKPSLSKRSVKYNAIN